MKILDVEIECNGRSDRVELFPFFDIHIGKANCKEDAIRKQIQEILRRDEMPGRHVRTLLGGDAMNAITSNDRRRFDFSDVADWVASGTPAEIKEALSDLPNREIKRIDGLFKPIKHTIIGALEGNHEKTLRKYYSMDAQAKLCRKLECENLTDEALIRFRFIRRTGKRGYASSMMVLYMRHGYGAGRSVGAEPGKLANMLAEWEVADVCLSGHSHTFCVLPPKPVAILSHKAKGQSELLWKHRFAANPGCWLESHSMGRGSYESNSCYPARAFMTCKVVIWPFFTWYREGAEITSPKIELRSYPIL